MDWSNGLLLLPWGSLKSTFNPATTKILSKVERTPATPLLEALQWLPISWLSPKSLEWGTRPNISSSLTSPSTTPPLNPSPHFSHGVFTLVLNSVYDTLHTDVGKICSLASLTTWCQILSKVFHGRESQVSSRDSRFYSIGESCDWSYSKVQFLDATHQEVVSGIWAGVLWASSRPSPPSSTLPFYSVRWLNVSTQEDLGSSMLKMVVFSSLGPWMAMEQNCPTNMLSIPCHQLNFECATNKLLPY